MLYASEADRYGVNMSNIGVYGSAKEKLCL